VMTSHTEDDLAFALQITEKVGKALGVIS